MRPARTLQAAQAPACDRDDAGDVVLVAMDRPAQGDPQGAPRERLYLKRREYQGRAFLDLRLHFRTEDGTTYAPLKKGVSIRQHETPEIIAALYRSLDDAGRARVRELLKSGGEKGGRDA
jgi:hypothetical protein